MADFDAHVLDRGRIVADNAYVVEGTSMATAESPDPDHDLREFPVYNVLIDHPDGTLLWDTGCHPDAGEGYWPAPLYEAFHHEAPEEYALPDVLADADYAIDDVDAVLMSHLHLDHAGGLRHFAGTETPIYVHEEELKYAYLSATTDEGSIAYLKSDFDRDLNWEVVHGGREEHFEGVEFLHLPGHTPGLLGLFLHLDDPVIVAGDEAYVRANYENGRPMSTSLLSSVRDWHESRNWLQDLQRRHDADVFCGHDPGDLARLQARFG